MNKYADLGVTGEMMRLQANKPIFVDLFCGTKSMSDNASLLDYFRVKTLDLSETVEADYTCDIMDVDDSHALSKWIEKKMKRGHIIVMHASPPCDQFSRMNTRGIRDIDGAMMLVKKAHEIMNKYSCVWTLENPATAGSLWIQPYAIENFTDSFHEVDYCGYGGILRKSTRFVFSDKDTAELFSPKKCSGETCASMIINPNTGRRIHANWEKMDYSSRIHIPQQLCYSLLNVLKTRARGISEEIAVELDKKTKIDNHLSLSLSAKRKRAEQKWAEVDWDVANGDIVVFASHDNHRRYTSYNIHQGRYKYIQMYWVYEHDIVCTEDENLHILSGFRYLGNLTSGDSTHRMAYLKENVIVPDQDIFYLLSEPSKIDAQDLTLTPMEIEKIMQAFSVMDVYFI